MLIRALCHGDPNINRGKGFQTITLYKKREAPWMRRINIEVLTRLSVLDNVY